MPMLEERILSLLTISRKAGKLLLGFDAVKDACRTGALTCILLAADISPKTEKEIRFYGKKIPIRKLKLSMETLKHYFRKQTAVFGVCDAGFTQSLLKLLPEPVQADDVGTKPCE